MTDAERLERVLREGDDREYVGDPLRLCDLLAAEVRRLRVAYLPLGGHAAAIAATTPPPVRRPPAPPG